MTKEIKVLIVDDSPFMRELISNLLSKDPTVKIAGKARNGQEALALVLELAPDVITMDIEMPTQDGLSALAEIMQTRPTPVIMLSSYTQSGAEATIKALEKGAIDFIAKPSGLRAVNLVSLQEELLDKVKAAAGARLGHQTRVPKAVKPKDVLVKSTRPLRNLIAIGTSTGGPKALQALVPLLPEDIPAGILIVQHMPPDFTKSLAQRLDGLSQVRVKEAEDGEEIVPGLALVAPGDFHLTVKKNPVGKLIVSLNKEAPKSGHRPSVDIMMSSVAQTGLPQVGVLLTGMGADGAEGMAKIKEAGGYTIAEDASTAVIFGMPRAAIERQVVDKTLALPNIAQEITKHLR